MTINRRNEERVTTNLPAKWNGMAGAHEARIEDLSLGGCFVNTTGRADIGELVDIQMKLPSGEWLPLRGTVVSYQQGIGFGIEFSFLTDEEERALKEFVER